MRPVAAFDRREGALVAVLPCAREHGGGRSSGWGRVAVPRRRDQVGQAGVARLVVDEPADDLLEQRRRKPDTIAGHLRNRRKRHDGRRCSEPRHHVSIGAGEVGIGGEERLGPSGDATGPPCERPAERSGRRIDLDWLRVAAFGLLILYHLGMLYVPWPYHAKSRHIVPALEPIMLAVNPWRLLLLFLISGVATRFIGATFPRPAPGPALAAASP